MCLSVDWLTIELKSIKKDSRPSKVSHPASQPFTILYMYSIVFVFYVNCRGAISLLHTMTITIDFENEFVVYIAHAFVNSREFC